MLFERRHPFIPLGDLVYGAISVLRIASACLDWAVGEGQQSLETKKAAWFPGRP